MYCIAHFYKPLRGQIFLGYYWATATRKIGFRAEAAIEAKHICFVMNTGVLSILTRASNL